MRFAFFFSLFIQPNVSAPRAGAALQGEPAALKDAVQCLKTHYHCVLVERHEEKQIKGYCSTACFMISS